MLPCLFTYSVNVQREAQAPRLEGSEYRSETSELYSAGTEETLRSHSREEMAECIKTLDDVVMAVKWRRALVDRKECNWIGER